MRLVRGVAALAAGVVLASLGPVPAAADDDVMLTGTYRRMAKEVDDGTSPSHAYEDLLEVGERTYRLRLRDGAKRPTPGAKVRVSAVQARTTARTPAGTSPSLTTSAMTNGGPPEVSVTAMSTLAEPTTASTVGTTKTLAILAYWTAPDSVTQARATSQLFSDDHSWLREASYGQAGLTGKVTPWVRIAAPTNGRCYEYAGQIMARAEAGAKNLGYDALQYDRTLVYFPKCTGTDTTNITGWAYEPGDSIWLNGVMDRRTSVHEHGHSYGLPHAFSYACTSGTTRVALSGSCTGKEYGDPFDAMGSSSYVAHFNAVNKERLGWLTGTRKRVMTTSSATFTLAPFERTTTTPVAAVVNSPQDGRRYWIEYRQPIGMDGRLPLGATGGVTIHLEDYGLSHAPLLLDMTPADGTFNAVALGPGRAFTAPDGVRIYVNSVSTSGASISVSGARAEPTPPSAPRSLTATPGDGRVMLAWAPPSSLGNSPVQGYSIRVSDGQSLHTYASETSMTVYVPNGVAYTYSVRAQNAVGEGPAATVTATAKESAPPVVRVASPANGATVEGTVTVVALATAAPMLDMSHYDWFVDGGHRYYESGDRMALDTRGLTNGPHTIRVVAWDEKSRSATAEITVDVLNLYPAVAITSPTAGSTVTGGIVTVTADATRAADDVPISHVEFHAGGTHLGTDTTAPYTVPWDVTMLGDYYYNVRAVTVDAKGRSHSATVQVYVQHPPPRVTITSPQQGASIKGTKVTVTADAVPGTPGTTITQVRFTGPYDAVVYDYSAPYEATFDISSTSGYAYFGATAYESSGRTGGRSVGVSVSNLLPEVTITAPPSPHRGRSLTLTGSAKPRTGGAPVDRVVVTLGAATATVTPGTDGLWSATFDTTGVYGYQYPKATAYDTAGLRAGTPGWWSGVYIERASPAVALVSPAAGTRLTTGTGTTYDVSFKATLPEWASTTLSRVCLGIVGSSYYYYGETSVGCATREADGVTWTVRGVAMPDALNYAFYATVHESDGISSRWYLNSFPVDGPPHAPTAVHVERRDDGALYVSWVSSATSLRPAKEFVVRDDDGTELARVTSPWATIRPGRLGVTRKFSIQAVNATGASPLAYTPLVAPRLTVDAVLTVPATPVTVGEKATVTVRFTRRHDGTPVVGLYAAAYAVPWGAMDEGYRIGPTAADGTTTLSFVATAHTDVTVQYSSDGPIEPFSTDWAHVPVRAKVTGNLTRGLMPLGSTSTFAGQVQPAYNGAFVYLQQYVNGTWKNLTYRKQDAYGRVSIPIKPAARGTYQYRLYYGGAGNAFGGVTSPARTLRVY